VRSSELLSPTTGAERAEKLFRPAGIQLCHARCRLEEIILADELSGFSRIDCAKAHCPFSEGPGGDRFPDNQRDARMPRITENAAVYLIDRFEAAFENLEEATVDVQKHPGNMTLGVGRTGMRQQRRDVGLVENRLGCACVDAVHQVRHGASTVS
jgi:hypothetical protein